MSTTTNYNEEGIMNLWLAVIEQAKVDAESKDEALRGEASFYLKRLAESLTK